MHRRIHVVGSGPRCGTTLLTELLAVGFAIDAHTEHETSIFEPPPEPCETFLSKLPGEIRVARAVLAANPRLWVLHMVRDPRDVVVSRHDKRPEVYWSNLRVWKQLRRASLAPEGHPRLLRIRYEDLVREPDRVQDRIADFLPFLTRRHRFSDYTRHARPSARSLDALGGVRAVAPDRIGAWRRHKPRLLAQIERHGSIDEDLVQLGYETDASWRHELAGVVPDNGESHLDEVRGVRDHLRRTLADRRKLRRYRRQLPG